MTTKRIWRMACIGIAVACAVAAAFLAWRKAAIKAHTHFCLNNLSQIDSAKEQCVRNRDLDRTAILTPEDIARYVADGLTGIHMRCPSSGHYTIGRTVEDEPKCSVHGMPSDPIYAY